VLDELEKRPAATTTAGAPAAPAPGAPAATAAPVAAPAPQPAVEPPAREPRSLRERHREAFALLRAGASAEDVGRREGIGAGELRLIRNLVAAEAQIAATPRS
jgi:hypothetical protein